MVKPQQLQGGVRGSYRKGDLGKQNLPGALLPFPK